MELGTVGALRSLTVGVLRADTDGRVVTANPAAKAMLGAVDDVSTDDLLRRARPDGEPVEGRRAHGDRHARWLRVHARRVDDSGATLFEVNDITEQRRLQRRLADREHRLARVEALASVGTWEWDVASDRVDWSPQLLSLFGFPPDTVLDYSTYRALVHPDDIGHIESTLAKALDTCLPFHYTHRMYLADRTTMRIFECHGEVTAVDGMPVMVLGTAHDITDQHRTQERLAFLAAHDPLTGLCNRRSLAARVDECIDDDRFAVSALLLIDIDNFKDINDLRGHPVGDEVIRVLARVLRDETDDDAVLGRLGGDEFAIMLPGADAALATAAADRIRRAIADQRVQEGGASVRVTASIGVALTAQASHSSVLLANADLALYEAKHAGRDQVKLFRAEQYHHAAARVSEAQRLRDALDTDGLVLYAQPVLSAASGRVLAHEVLLRLHDGLAPALGPAEFLTAVDNAELLRRVDRWIVGQVIDQLAQAADIRLTVNVSQRTLDDVAFADHVAERLASRGVAPGRLGIEISEAVALDQLEHTRSVAQLLAAAGCAITLDNFGTRFSRFADLSELPLDAVKIAGHVVDAADTSGGGRIVLDAIVRLAATAGLRTIAVHVHRDELPDVLRAAGVDALQGFALGRPRPLADVLAASTPVGG